MKSFKATPKACATCGSKIVRGSQFCSNCGEPVAAEAPALKSFESALGENAAIRLLPGERVLVDVMPSRFWTFDKYVKSAGLWAIWRKRHHFVLTDRRIVHYRGMVAKTELSIPLDRVQDFRLARSPNRGGQLVLSTAGGSLGLQTIAPLTRSDARVFADNLTAELGRRGRCPFGGI